MSDENQLSEVKIHLEKVASNGRNAATSLLEPTFLWEIAQLSFDIEKETRTSGTYRYRIQTVCENVKFLSLLS